MKKPDLKQIAVDAKARLRNINAAEANDAVDSGFDLKETAKKVAVAIKESPEKGYTAAKELAVKGVDAIKSIGKASKD